MSLSCWVFYEEKLPVGVVVTFIITSKSLTGYCELLKENCHTYVQISKLRNH